VGGSLARYLVASAVLHVAVSGSYLGFASSRPKMTRPPVYRARVVSLPGPRGPAANLAMPEPAAPQKKEPPKEQVKTAKPRRETTRVPSREKEKKPKAAETAGERSARAKTETKGLREDRRTGGMKGKIEAPAGAPTALPGGGSASLGVDAADFTFSYYLSTIQNRIAAEWDPPAGLAAGAPHFAVILFQIEKDGRIVRPEVETSSGVPYFDETARRAVQRAQLPPLPEEFGDERLGVHFQFEYTP
jgi:TonB family protein